MKYQFVASVATIEDKFLLCRKDCDAHRGIHRIRTEPACVVFHAAVSGYRPRHRVQRWRCVISTRSVWLPHYFQWRFLKRARRIDAVPLVCNEQPKSTTTFAQGRVQFACEDRCGSCTDERLLGLVSRANTRRRASEFTCAGDNRCGDICIKELLARAVYYAWGVFKRIRFWNEWRSAGFLTIQLPVAGLI